MGEPLPDLSVCVAGCSPPEATRRFLRAVHDTAGQVDLEVFAIRPDAGADFSALQAEFPGLTLLAPPPGGSLAAGINRAIAASRGRYFSVWDDTTVVAQGCLPALVDFFDEVPDAGVAGPKLRDRRGTIQPVARAFPSFFSLLAATDREPPGRPAAGWSEYAGGEADWYAGPGLTISRLLLDDIGGVHPGLALYWPVEFCLRARRAGWHVHYLNNAQATGSLAAWQRAMGRGALAWRLWEACLLAAARRFR